MQKRVKVKNNPKAKRIKTTQIGGTSRKALNRFFSNYFSLEKPFVMPRRMRTTVAPKLYHGQYKLDIAAGESLFLATHPDPENFLVMSRDRVAGSLLTPSPKMSFSKKQAWSQPLWLDSTLITDDGLAVKSETTDSDGVHWSDSSSGLAAGAKRYPMTFSVSGNATCRVTNPGNVQVQVQFDFIKWNQFGATVHATGTATVAGRTSGTATVVVTGLGTGDENSTAWGIKCTLLSGGDSGVFNTPEGFSIEVNMPDMTLNTYSGWEVKSIWDMIPDSGVARDAFRKAQRYCVTAFNTKMTNVSAEIDKGGNYALAHVVGDTSDHLSGSPDALFSQISAFPYSVSGVNSGKEGSYYAWTPEKPQDLLFQQHVQQDPYAGNPLNKPFCVMVFNSTSGTAQTYQFSWRMMVELVSNDINNYYVQSMASPQMCDLVLTELVKGPIMSGNPTHFRAMAKRVSEILSDPLVKQTARIIGEAALAIGSTLLL